MCGIIFLQDRGDVSCRFLSLAGRNQQSLLGQKAKPDWIRTLKPRSSSGTECNISSGYWLYE